MDSGSTGLLGLTNDHDFIVLVTIIRVLGTLLRFSNIDDVIVFFYLFNLIVDEALDAIRWL